MYSFKKDKFQKARGGSSRVLDISCAGCGIHLSYYQKDGPGILKRMYVDRFIDKPPAGQDLVCSSCKRILGNLIIYKKENRQAYRLYVGSTSKKIMRIKDISKNIIN